CFLRLNYVPAPYTMVRGIEKLAPGHVMEWTDGQTRSHAYWQPPTEIRHRTLEDAKDELDRLLRDSVREHLISDVPVGIWLSGGIDSSTIVHYASDIASGRLKTFSITFHGRSFDESRYIAAVSKHYETDHVELDLNEGLDLPSAIEQFAYYSDDPCADAGALPVWFLAEMSARDVTVALSGEGADELFGGYITYLADTYARRARIVPRALRRLSLRSANRLRASNKKIGFDYKLQRFLHGTLLDERNSHIFWNGTFSSDQRRQLMLSHDDSHLLKLLATIPALGDVRRFMAFD